MSKVEESNVAGSRGAPKDPRGTPTNKQPNASQKTPPRKKAQGRNRPAAVRTTKRIPRRIPPPSGFLSPSRHVGPPPPPHHGRVMPFIDDPKDPKLGSYLRRAVRVVLAVCSLYPSKLIVSNATAIYHTWHAAVPVASQAYGVEAVIYPADGKPMNHMELAEFVGSLCRDLHTQLVACVGRMWAERESSGAAPVVTMSATRSPLVELSINHHLVCRMGPVDLMFGPTPNMMFVSEDTDVYWEGSWVRYPVSHLTFDAALRVLQSKIKEVTSDMGGGTGRFRNIDSAAARFLASEALLWSMIFAGNIKPYGLGKTLIDKHFHVQGHALQELLKDVRPSCKVVEAEQAVTDRDEPPRVQHDTAEYVQGLHRVLGVLDQQQTASDLPGDMASCLCRVQEGAAVLVRQLAHAKEECRVMREEAQKVAESVAFAATKEEEEEEGEGTAVTVSVGTNTSGPPYAKVLAKATELAGMRKRLESATANVRRLEANASNHKEQWNRTKQSLCDRHATEVERLREQHAQEVSEKDALIARLQTVVRTLQQEVADARAAVAGPTKVEEGVQSSDGDHAGEDTEAAGPVSPVTRDTPAASQPKKKPSRRRRRNRGKKKEKAATDVKESSPHATLSVLKLRSVKRMDLDAVSDYIERVAVVLMKAGVESNMDGAFLANAMNKKDPYALRCLAYGMSLSLDTCRRVQSTSQLTSTALYNWQRWYLSLPRKSHGDALAEMESINTATSNMCIKTHEALQKAGQRHEGVCGQMHEKLEVLSTSMRSLTERTRLILNAIRTVVGEVYDRMCEACTGDMQPWMEELYARFATHEEVRATLVDATPNIRGRTEVHRWFLKKVRTEAVKVKDKLRMVFAENTATDLDDQIDRCLVLFGSAPMLFSKCAMCMWTNDDLMNMGETSNSLVLTSVLHDSWSRDNNIHIAQAVPAQKEEEEDDDEEEEEEEGSGGDTDVDGGSDDDSPTPASSRVSMGVLDSPVRMGRAVMAWAFVGCLQRRVKEASDQLLASMELIFEDALGVEEGKAAATTVSSEERAERGRSRSKAEVERIKRLLQHNRALYALPASLNPSCTDNKYMNVSTMICDPISSSWAMRLSVWNALRSEVIRHQHFVNGQRSRPFASVYSDLNEALHVWFPKAATLVEAIQTARRKVADCNDPINYFTECVNKAPSIPKGRAFDINAELKKQKEEGTVTATGPEQRIFNGFLVSNGISAALRPSVAEFF